jgi:hypothetical protein
MGGREAADQSLVYYIKVSYQMTDRNLDSTVIDVL